MTPSTAERPVRVGIYHNFEQADRAVAELARAGFSKNHISVICSDEAVREHFPKQVRKEPAGDHALAGIAAGSSIGAVLGGLIGVTALTTGAGLPIVAAGALGAASGALAGALPGVMSTRGVTKEMANYYDQAVEQGEILVAVEDEGKDSAERLARAEGILRETGARPIELPEG